MNFFDTITVNDSNQIIDCIKSLIHKSKTKDIL